MYQANNLDHHWMPFTANRAFRNDPRLVVRGEGVYYWTQQGARILDGSSGLFCCAAGHGRRQIADAVHAQLAEMEYVPHFQMGHPSSFEVARRLSGILPEGVNRVFFVNSGSEAVDTAMKIALAWHRVRGEGHRTRFVSRERAYHGVNLGGTSLQGLVRNREMFGPLLPGVVHIRHTWQEATRFQRGQPETGAELAEDLQRACDLVGGSNIAACFIEPIAGSTGTLVPPQGYLERIREICTQHGILLVLDEVICGFGRTGQAFGAQSFGIDPDIMTMAKALTNGALPMGAVAVREEIHNTLLEQAPEGAIELFHGYTYSGHPASCAAALATLDIYEQESLFERARSLSDGFLDAVWSLQELDCVTDIRGYGMMAGIDLRPQGKPGTTGPRVQAGLFHAGVHIKATGDSLIIAPPFVIEPEQIGEMLSVIRSVLGKIYA